MNHLNYATENLITTNDAFLSDLESSQIDGKVIRNSKLTQFTTSEMERL